MEDSDDEQPTVALHAGPPSESDTTITLTDEQPLGPGADVGGYVIEGVLGQGGMGVVYAATHPVIGKRAAIKVLRPELSRDHTAVERFVNEARAVNQIGHPNIVDIFAFGALPDGRSYYVMDLLVGESLRTRLKRGPLHVSEAASVIDEVASALIAAHGKGIIHRDLKPDNVYMVTHPGRWPEVKLLDWGLAKLAPRLDAKTRTLAGQVMGTPAYMSPEQARAGEIDPRTDIYALGVMSYELLAGEVPFKKRTSIDTILAHQEEPPPALAQRAPLVPEEITQLIDAMLAKEPEDRPTLQAVRAVLKRLRGTKIPTMTAAGLQMPAESLVQPFVEPPTGSPPTIRELKLSPELTNPQAARLPLSAPPPSAQISVPMANPFPMTKPGYSVPPMYSSPYGSVPPQLAPMPSGPPPRVNTPLPVSSPRRWIVIMLAALVASGIGIAIALLT